MPGRFGVAPEVQVDVAGQHLVQGIALADGFAAASRREPVEAGQVRRFGDNFRVMKFMAPDAGAGRAQKAIARQGDFPVAQGFQPGEHPDAHGQNAGHGVALTFQVGNFLTEIHQAAALGVDGEARRGPLFYNPAHGLVGAQLRRAKFGVAAPQVQTVEVRGEVRIRQG